MRLRDVQLLNPTGKKGPTLENDVRNAGDDRMHVPLSREKLSEHSLVVPSNLGSRVVRAVWAEQVWSLGGYMGLAGNRRPFAAR